MDRLAVFQRHNTSHTRPPVAGIDDTSLPAKPSVWLFHLFQWRVNDIVIPFGHDTGPLAANLFFEISRCFQERQGTGTRPTNARPSRCRDAPPSFARVGLPFILNVTTLMSAPHPAIAATLFRRKPGDPWTTSAHTDGALGLARLALAAPYQGLTFPG